jgi:Zn-dependent M28 family amino/carboxypeptidase
MIKNTFFCILAVIGISMVVSCGGKKNNSDGTDTTKIVTDVNVPTFNSDSAYNYIKAQVDFGSRVPNSDAHKKCADYLIAKLKSFTKDVVVQEAKVKSFDGKTLNIKNIVASFKPGNNNRIFISSHWDSRPFADQDADVKNHKTPILGANDGASGVGIIIELARLLSINPPPIGVDLVLFDAEDYGQPENSGYAEMEDSWCLGSQYWAKNPHVKDYYAKFGILLDMVGGEGATFTMEGTSMQYAPDIMKNIWDTASRIGYSDYFLYSKTGAITDDHVYINEYAKIPTIDIIHHDSSTPSGFYKYWHTLKDDMDGINKNTLNAVGQTLLTVIFQEEATASK